MLVGIKNVSKLIGISIIACCAVLVCTMFLNFYFDIRLIESEITSELSMFFYNAQVSTAKVVCLVSGGCLLLTALRSHTYPHLSAHLQKLMMKNLPQSLLMLQVYMSCMEL